MHDPDAELVERLAAGDPAAAEALVRAKLPRMVALARRLLGNAAEAEEVAQEVFVRAWRQAARWRPGEARFDTWLHRVATNLCTDRLRRRRERPLPEGWDAVDPHMPDEELTEAQTSARVEQALAALAPRQREAIVLTYYQELPNRDAAAIMGLSVDALESLLSRGRRALRERLGGERD